VVDLLLVFELVKVGLVFDLEGVEEFS